MNESDKITFTDEEALAFHKYPRPGKIGVVATKPMATFARPQPGLFAGRGRACARHRRKS